MTCGQSAKHWIQNDINKTIMKQNTYLVQWPMGKAVVKMKQFKQPHVAELILKGWASNWLGLEFNEIHIAKP